MESVAKSQKNSAQKSDANFAGAKLKNFLAKSSKKSIQREIFLLKRKNLTWDSVNRRWYGASIGASIFTKVLVISPS